MISDKNVSGSRSLGSEISLTVPYCSQQIIYKIMNDSFLMVEITINLFFSVVYNSEMIIKSLFLPFCAFEA